LYKGSNPDHTHSLRFHVHKLWWVQYIPDAWRTCSAVLCLAILLFQEKRKEAKKDKEEEERRKEDNDFPAGRSTAASLQCPGFWGYYVLKKLT
jgi:hypothetical protein